LNHFVTQSLRASFIVPLVVSLVGSTGCAKDDGRVKVYPVSGKVRVQGKPVEGARVVLYALDEELKKPGMPIPDGMTDAEGNFKLRSYDPDDGAPEGEFKVCITWLEAQPDGRIADTPTAKDRLDGRYASPQKSNLTATVEKGGGEIGPFDLQ
jgi:hypothetical protein